MIKLNEVGFFKELDHGNPDGPSLKDAVGILQSEELEKIVFYLKSAHLFIASPGIVKDVLNSKHRIIGSLNIMTDGTWVWPSDLAYYVEKYHVSLPNAFISHMVENNWIIKAIDLASLEL